MFGRLLVDGVDVTAFVTAGLDRRHPERVRVREMRTVEEHRAAWDGLTGLWAGSVSRARALDEAARHERADDEWSVTETLRHLGFATDCWAGRMVLELPGPYHPLGLPPPTSSPRTPWRPASTRRRGPPSRRCWRCGPGDPDFPRPVRECLRVIMKEECEHRRSTERDQAVPEAR